MKDIFDLENISDLPDGFIKRLTPSDKVICLFEKKEILTTNEIRAALFRMHKIEISPAQIFSLLNNLTKCKNPKIKKFGVATYQKITEDSA